MTNLCTDPWHGMPATGFGAQTRTCWINACFRESDPCSDLGLCKDHIEEFRSL